MNFLWRRMKKHKSEQERRNYSEQNKYEGSVENTEIAVTLPCISSSEYHLEENAKVRTFPQFGVTDILPKTENADYSIDVISVHSYPTETSYNRIEKCQASWLLPHTRIITATMEGFELRSIFLMVKLETVSVCKECDNIFDDVSRLLETILEKRVKKVLIVTVEGQGECYGCFLCNKTTVDEDAMKRHLLNHIKLNEVTCNCCWEKTISDSLPVENETNPFEFDRSLEIVMITQISTICETCNRNIVTSELFLPEAISIQEVPSDGTEKLKPYACAKCGCRDLQNINGIVQPLSYDSCINVICNRCEKTNATRRERNDDVMSFGSEDVRSASVDVETCEMHATCPRHLMIPSKDYTLRLRAEDFTIERKDRYKGLIWRTCRFCGETRTDYEETMSHVVNHIVPNGVPCKECSKDILHI